jgi:nicotinamidase-related amidase
MAGRIGTMDKAGTTALLVIDVQAGLVQPAVGEALHDSQGLLARIGGLIAAARDAGLPVIFVRHDGGAGDELQAGTPGWQLHPALGARPGEPVVEKQHADSFRGTNLGALLRQLRVQRLVLCGAQSDYCVDTTCRRAASEGFAVVLAADAHSTVGNGVIDAATIIRHENRTLAGFARVADSAALLAEGLGAGSGA